MLSLRQALSFPEIYGTYRFQESSKPSLHAGHGT